MIIDFIEKLRQQMAEKRPVSVEDSFIHPIFLERLQRARNKIPSDANHAELMAFSQSDDGFIRQAALERLSTINDSAAFRLLLVRLNDWVPAVRNVASRLIIQFINEQNAKAVIASLDDVMKLFDQSRDNHVRTLQMVENLLTQPSVRPLLLEQFKTLRAPTARYTFSFMLKWPQEALAAALPIVIGHADCLLRMMVLDVCKAEPLAHVKLIELLLQDPQPSVRQASVRLVMDDASHKLDQSRILKKALLDESSGVRDVAHWYARQTGFSVTGLIDEVLAQYRENQIPPSNLIGLMGLEKNVVYLETIKAATASLCSVTRATAYWAWLQMPGIDQESLTLRMLEDPNQRIFRYGLRHSTKNHIVLPLEKTKQLIRDNVACQRKIRALAIAERIPVWERLAFLLELIVNNGNEQNIALLNALVVRWTYAQAHCYLTIPSSLIVSIDQSLDALQNKHPKLQPGVQAEIVRICKERRR